ncbi:MAG: DoxX family protein [Verrucomicrobia bacterium]|nr:DoxX family protein [Verrucomicrobiota bacterium]
MKRFLSRLFITSDDGNLGLLLLRVFVGAAMMTHGIPKIMGGPEFWAKVGGVMAKIGVPGPAVAWGFMAAMAEGVGSFLLLLGAFTTISSFLIVFTMSVAAFVAHSADPFATREMALLYLFIALFFLLKGAGRYSVDALIRRST